MPIIKKPPNAEEILQALIFLCVMRKAVFQTDTTADATGTTWVYTYDVGGNILTKKAYVYTTGSVSGLTPVESHTFTYGQTTIGGVTYGRNDCRDQLAAYDGVGIT